MIKELFVTIMAFILEDTLSNDWAVSKRSSVFFEDDVNTKEKNAGTRRAASTLVDRMLT